MQNYFKINGVVIKQPTKYTPNFTTTSTDDSGRNQYYNMVNIPIGTVASYSLEWQDLTLSEYAEIMSNIVNKANFTLHYMDPLTGTWKDGTFYATTYNSSALTLEDGYERWESLSFNAIKVEAIK